MTFPGNPCWLRFPHRWLARQLPSNSSDRFIYDFDTWKTVEPPLDCVYNYPPRGDELTSVVGHPARPEVAAQIYNEALHAAMVSKFAQGGQQLDDVIKWASRELAAYLRI